MRNDDFSGNVRGFKGKNSPEKKDVKDWQKESNEILKKENQPVRVVTTTAWKTLIFLSSIFLLLFLSLAGYFVYLTHEGMLQSVISQPINIQPGFNQTTNNQYAFNPTTTNVYQINNTIVFPNNLTLRVTNVS